MGDGTKTDELSEKFQRRAGHFQSKKLNCRFWTVPGLTTTRKCPFPGYRSLFEVSAIILSILSFTASIPIAYAVFPFFFLQFYEGFKNYGECSVICCNNFILWT